MKKVTVLFLAVFLFALSSSVFAKESLKTNLVPADAKWLIHIDVAKFSKTELKNFLEENSDNEFGRGILGIEKTTGIDFFVDISSITVIGMNQKNAEPVIAFSGNLDKSYLLGLLKSKETPSEIPYGDFQIYTWNGDENGVFVNDSLLIFSENRSALNKVLDTISGKGKDFSGTPLEKQLRTLSPDTFLVASAENVASMLDDDDDDFGTLILKKTKSAIFTANEKSGKMKLHLSLQTDSPETAANMESMVAGLKAFLAMNEKVDPEMAILKSLSVSKNGAFVILESEGSIDELLFLLGKNK